VLVVVSASEILVAVVETEVVETEVAGVEETGVVGLRGDNSEMTVMRRMAI